MVFSAVSPLPGFYIQAALPKVAPAVQHLFSLCSRSSPGPHNHNLFPKPIRIFATISHPAPIRDPAVTCMPGFSAALSSRDAPHWGPTSRWLLLK